jgi:TRAP transporter 4TM/12TM fusion protein
MWEHNDSRKSPALEFVIGMVAILMIIYHLLSVWFPVLNALLHQNIHLAFSMMLLFLIFMRTQKKSLKILFGLGAVVSLICGIYIHVEYERLHMYAGWPENIDIIVGMALVVLVFYLTWKEWGAVIPVLVGIAILYALFGHHIKGSLGHAYLEPTLIISNLGIGFEGIYGMMLNASANMIFLFIIFGSLFEVVGINRFFLAVGIFFGRRLRGGSAQTAVFSSSFVGMMMGVPAANVALTGAYTIPSMKKTGFTPEYASAIEAVASTGGQLTPPVMGVAVFLMAGFLGTTYANLMATALVPALLFYVTVFLGILLIAHRENIPMVSLDIDKRALMTGAPLFVIPMVLIIILLMWHYTPAYAAFFAIVALLLIAVSRKRTRPSAKDLTEGLIKGAIIAAGIAVACGLLGMFTKMLVSTGAAQKLAGLVQFLSGGNLIVGLFLIMLLSILLGCALPTIVAYVLVALLVAPVLVDMGINRTVAHFFVFYYAILANVTPPVAHATLVGSKIAGGSYYKASWESLKLTAPFYMVPYFIVKNPIILSKSQPFFEAICAFLALVIACGAMLVFCQGFCYTKTGFQERSLFLLTALLATYFGQYGGYTVLISAFILFTALLMFQQKRRRKRRDI